MELAVAQELLQWYQDHQRDLPWRESREPYPVLVSELMLQQTTVAAVIPLYRRWMARFPTLPTLAAATADEVTEAWAGLGYYSRARRLREAAALLSEHGYPADLAGWRALPGLGPYTAAAVCSIALGLPHLALDTNALRVLLRYFGRESRPDNAAAQAELRARMEGALPMLDFGILNQAIMELGATLCRPREPACLLCPLQRGCQAKASSRQHLIPLAKPTKPAREAEAVAFLLEDSEGGVILVRGTSVGLLGDLFQPPLDFSDENDPGSPLTQLLAWLREGQSCSAGELTYGISGRRLKVRVRLSARSADELESRAKASGVETRRYGGAAGEGKLALSSLTRKILKAWAESPATSRPRDGKH